MFLKTMAKINWGPTVKKRTYQLLDGIIHLTTSQIDNRDNFKIEFDKKTEKSVTLKTEVRYLVSLTNACGYQLTKENIKESLHRLKDLGILDDHRIIKTKGCPLWHFSLTLWHPFNHKNLNLDRFNQEWDKFKGQLKEMTIITPQQYNDQGIDHYLKGDITQAIEYFNKAICLDNNYAIAHYNLASIYEDSQNYEQARQEYTQAILRGLCVAYNNLGRLFILQKEYTKAINLLLQGLDKAELSQEKFALYKNLGWARFQQKRYQEAEAYLLQALEIDDKKGSVYGLLGQTWEALDKSKKAQLAYQNCIRYASIYHPEEDEWLQLAREKSKL